MCRPRTATVRLLFVLLGLGGLAAAESATVNIPFADARPILDVLQPQLWPADLRGKTPAALESLWPEWVTREDAAIRARIQAGDEDSIVNFLLFGTSFTKQPRATETQLAGIVVRQRETGATTFLPSPLLKGRIDDFIVGLASPGGNERLQFAREVIARLGIDSSTDAGRTRLRRYLEDRAALVGSAVHAPTLSDPNAPLVDQITIFRDRGLSSDSAIPIEFGIEQALAAIRADGPIAPASVRRVAIVGPGLDFTDKQEGYDFYPPQTIQPFAVIDSLRRIGLAAPAGVQVTTFDLSPRVLAHIAAARRRAGAGRGYTLVLPRATDRSWSAELTAYWQRFGDRIGQRASVPPAPPAAGRVDVRGVLVQPSVVLAIEPRDLNIVLQRVEPLAAGEQFDLVLATNILLYYDVFEQSLAVANIAKMLRPGGLFLTNDRLLDLPAAPVRSAGERDVTYMKLPDSSVKGDHLTWYQRSPTPR
jgi:SAM-dependent methyltransferase